MRIAVYGATGRVGSKIVHEAAQRGHEVTALARASAADVPAGVRYQHGDATDLVDVATVAGAHDVVVSALGPSREPGGDPDTFTGVVGGLIDAVGATRLAVVGGAGSLLTEQGVRLVDTAEFPEIYKREALAQAAALEVLRAAARPDLDWSYLSPAPEIGDGERTGSYRSGTDNPVGGFISFADYALALVDELETPAHRNARWTVAAR